LAPCGGPTNLKKKQPSIIVDCRCGNLEQNHQQRFTCGAVERRTRQPFGKAPPIIMSLDE
jgi:hypothetical protein